MEVLDLKILIGGAVLVFFILIGFLAFILRWSLFTSTEGAVKRLNEDIAKVNAKQSELMRKLREADDELNRKRAEAKDLVDRMRADAETMTKQEREKIIQKAREESEEIIAKANHSKEKIRKEIEQDMENKAIHYGVTILSDILSQRSQSVFSQVLVEEFVEKLKTVDVSKINPSIQEMEVVTLVSLGDQHKTQISQVLNNRLNRQITLKASTDPKIGGGVVLKFGSMALDGSIRSLIREKAVDLQKKIENS
jgi:F0F1-type ATP synthase delta subunit